MELFSRTLVIALDALFLLFCIFINTKAYPLGRYKPSPPSTKELHGVNFLIIFTWQSDRIDASLTKANCTSIQKVYKGTAASVLAQGRVGCSVTRLGDFLHFEQPFKAGGNNYFNPNRLHC